MTTQNPFGNSSAYNYVDKPVKTIYCEVELDNIQDISEISIRQKMLSNMIKELNEYVDIIEVSDPTGFNRKYRGRLRIVDEEFNFIRDEDNSIILGNEKFTKEEITGALKHKYPERFL
jgi:hypothetical protein